MGFDWDLTFRKRCTLCRKKKIWNHAQLLSPFMMVMVVLVMFMMVGGDGDGGDGGDLGSVGKR